LACDSSTSFFWGSSFNDGTTQTALDPPRGGAGSHPLRVQTMVGGRELGLVQKIYLKPGWLSCAAE
jgi:hypothetical protein